MAVSKLDMKTNCDSYLCAQRKRDEKTARAVEFFRRPAGDRLAGQVSPSGLRRAGMTTRPNLTNGRDGDPNIRRHQTTAPKQQ
jgi:hypothetical protein